MNKLRLIVFLLLAYSTTYAQNKVKMSISFENTTIENAIKQLDSKTAKYNFSYSNNLPDLQKKVNKTYTNKTMKSILNDLFAGTYINYEQVGSTIVLVNKNKKKSKKQKKNKTISGYVYDKQTGETLIGASIVLSDYSNGTITNVYGFYSISIPNDINGLKISYLGYKQQDINLENKSRLDIYLQTTDNVLTEVVVEAKNDKTKLMSGSKTITVKQIKEMPQLLGEPDIIKAVQTQSGIKTITDGSSFYYVRGGNFDQNLVLIDEAPLYNPSHLMGLVSVINGDAIKNSQFYKGYFPAQYSGKLSSVLDIVSKDGNNQEFHVNGGISTIGARMSAEGPIVKDKASYSVSLRKSWVDEVIKLMKKNKNILSPTFYDINAKVNWKLNSNNRVYMSFYQGYDMVKQKSEDINVKWYNRTASLRWNHIYNAKLFANTSVIYNQFKSSTKVSKLNPEWLGSIHEGRFVHRLNYYANDNNTFVGGVKAGIHFFSPGWQDVDNVNIGTKELISSDLFLEHKIKIAKQLTVNYGINLKYINAVSNDYMIELNDKYEVVKEFKNGKGKNKNWFDIEPRANINYAVNSHNNIFASYSRMNQYSHSLFPYQNDFDIFKMWIPVSNNIEPMQSDIVSVGYKYASKYLSWGLESYYKKVKNQLDYTPYPDLQSKYYERYLRAGKGYSYGFEFNFGYNAEKYNVEFNYAYSKTKLKTPDVNGGREYISRYDIPHQINITAKYNLTKRWQVSAYWKFASGKPFTLPVGTQMVNGGTNVIPIYGERYNARFFNYHRLDVMATLLPSDKDKKFKGTLSFGVMNAYGKDNPIAISYRYDYTTMNPESQSFLKWLPMISYQVKF